VKLPDPFLAPFSICTAGIAPVVGWNAAFIPADEISISFTF